MTSPVGVPELTAITKALYPGPKLFYQQDGMTIWHADSTQWTWDADVMVTDPPYGTAYSSGHFGTLPRSIVGDEDTLARDRALHRWGHRPALVFGSRKRPMPEETRMTLIWDTGGALGMGALDLPWKPSHQEIYVLGKGFQGRRTSNVLQFAPVQSLASNGRLHPHEKPVGLLRALIAKCPPGIIFDPFMGSGSTLVAAKTLGRQAVGVEVDERYCEIAAKRLAQGVLDLWPVGKRTE